MPSKLSMRRPYTSVSPEERKKIVRFYVHELLPQALIARRFDLTELAVRRILREENVHRPSRELNVR
jgi:transposase-like protein